MIDNTLKRMLEDIKESYFQLLLIFQEISTKSSEGKLDSIEETQKRIFEIE